MLLHHMSSSAYVFFRFLGHRCRHQYCWICLADYALIRKDGNTQHRSDCTYHTSNIAGNILDLDHGPVLARLQNRMALYRAGLQTRE